MQETFVATMEEIGKRVGVTKRTVSYFLNPKEGAVLMLPVSTCHGWGSIPAHAISRYLLGVDLSQIFKNKITIKLGLPGYFKRFTYKVPIANELLWVEFYGDGSKYEIEVVEKPDNITVEIAKDLVSL